MPAWSMSRAVDIAIPRPGSEPDGQMARWRCSLADGSRISVMIGGKDTGKAVLGLSHERHVSSKAVERWGAFWKGESATL
jgi:hypothetical protein